MENNTNEEFTVWITVRFTEFGLQKGKSKMGLWYGDDEIEVNMIDECDGRILLENEEGETWHRTRESAIARANVLRNEKIRKLHEMITEIETIDIEKLLPED